MKFDCGETPKSVAPSLKARQSKTTPISFKAFLNDWREMHDGDDPLFLNSSEHDDSTLFVVYLCGCTDCFPHMIFSDEDRAYAWAEKNSHNPEGYMIRKLVR